MKNIFFLFIFLFSSSLLASNEKSFFVMVDSPAYRNKELTVLANYEIVRDSTFCKGPYMSKAIGRWKCLSRKKKYCVREYSCRLSNKLWNRNSEYKKNKKRLSKQGIPRGAPINISFAKKMNEFYKDKLSKKQSAVQKGHSRTQYAEYKLKKGDTFMKVAFQLYGDYRRWRDLMRLNYSRLSGSKRLVPGSYIKYSKENMILIKNKGRPYYIKGGDNLHIIARKVYGDEVMWKTIWKNNPQMIKNPDLIFTDFTLYYPNPNEEEEDDYDHSKEFY